MSISCECDWGDEAAWYWETSADFTALNTMRSRKCCSCGTKIKPGDDCYVLHRHRHPASYIEERIHGDEVPLAPYHLCESCGGLLMSVSDLGLCWNIGDNIKTDVREWAEAQQYAREQKLKA